MADRDQVVAHLRTVFGDQLGELTDRIATVPEGDAPAEPSAPHVGNHVMVAAAAGLAKVGAGREDQLSPAEQAGLEAIVVLEGRPPLFVQGGDFQQPPPLWAVLDDHRPAIRDSIARVGRVEVDGHPDLAWLGTGFLAGPTAIITNRHVAREFAEADGAAWRFQSGMSARLDFNEEYGAIDPREFAVTGILGIHEVHDLAVLSIEQTGGAGALPGPLVVAGKQPGDVVDRAVYVVGYPAWDGRRNDPDYMAQTFRSIYNVKRLQPGRVTHWTGGEGEFRHDCSTLGGNSGSPVFDLDTHAVVGLHFGGTYLVANHAVALWRLTGDELLTAAGVNFG